MTDDLKDLMLKTPGAQPQNVARMSRAQRRQELLQSSVDHQEPETWAERYSDQKTAEELLKKLGAPPPPISFGYIGRMAA